jgi:hypothetical protein
MGTRLRFFSDECWVVPRRPAAPSAEAVGNTTPPGTEVVTDRSTKLASVPRAARREAQREAARSAEREARQEVGAPVAQAPGTPAQPAGPSDTEGGRRPKASPDSKPGVVPNAEPECEADSEPGVKPDSEMDCEVNFEPGADPDQKPDCEANSESGIEPDNESECESDFEPGAGSYFEPDWVEALVDPAGMEAQKALYAEVEAAIEEAREAVKLDPGAPGPIVVVEITNKVMGDHFYLRPDPEVDDILLGVLGRSIEKTGVAFYAGHGMSNHQGMLVGVNSCHAAAVEVGPVQVHVHIGSAAEEPASPGGRQRIDVQTFVADETVDLFDGVLVAEVVDRSQPTADGMNVER